MKTLKEKLIWDLANEILETHGDRVDSMDIVESNEYGDDNIKIYHGEGHCFELEKQTHCEPEEINDYNDIHELQKDGCTYHFDEPWDNFTQIGIDKAIKKLEEYAIISNEAS